MKNITRHVGKLEIVERLPRSLNGNARFKIRVDGFTCVTAPDSGEADTVKNLDGAIVEATIGTLRGKATLNSIKKIDNVKNKKPLVTDERYSIQLEFCGQPKQMHVVRFCGEFVSQHDGLGVAEMAALDHCIKRNGDTGKWKLLARVGSAIWLIHGKLHRVAYGADVRDFRIADRDIKAAEFFGLCIRHELECEGKI